MYVGVTFFTGATIAVLGFHNTWTIRHLGVLANGALAIGSWVTLLIGRPFTLDYARQHTDPAKWHDPVFIRVNELFHQRVGGDVHRQHRDRVGADETPDTRMGLPRGQLHDADRGGGVHLVVSGPSA